jgi:hypothetical protein
VAEGWMRELRATTTTTRAELKKPQQLKVVRASQ